MLLLNSVKYFDSLVKNEIMIFPPKNMNDYVVLKVEIETMWSLLY
jgi:hypothetical protein